jgi:hypothetical protein
VAYIDEESVFGFNGKHLGWFKDGVIYDHSGKLVVAPAERFQEAVSVAPTKGFKQFKPFKSFKEFKPFEPFLSVSWSGEPAIVFFLAGVE